MTWTFERLNSVRRDIAFDGHAYIYTTELDEFKQAIGQIPLIYTATDSEFTRVELPPISGEAKP